MIEPQAIDALIRGIAQALESPDAQGEFLRGEIAFVLNCEGLVLLRGVTLVPTPASPMNN